MHKEVIEFCQEIQSENPQHFEGKKVLDVGSADINGNNRYLFTDCEYMGIDIWETDNVDYVLPVHQFQWQTQFYECYDTVISTEMLEHDKYWKESIKAMYRLTKKGGLLLITCAGPNRPEHGTIRTTPNASPHTTDYYKNITLDMIGEAMKELLNDGEWIKGSQYKAGYFSNERDTFLVLYK